MRGSLVALGIAVVVMAGAVVVALNTGQAVAGTPVAGDRPPPQPACAGGDELVASGSTLVIDALTPLTAAYEAACPGKSVSYTPSGQGAGIQDFIAGTTGMAITDRPLDAGELAQAGQRCEVRQLPFVVHPLVIRDGVGGDLVTLDPPTLAKIFSGAITRWDDPAIAALNEDVAVAGVPITVVSRADESGSTAVLQQYLAAVGGWTGGTGTTFTGRSGLAVRGGGGVMAALEVTRGAIGYLLSGAGWEDRGLPINGVAPDLDAMARTMSAALPDDGLVFDPATLYRVDPADGAYPIVSVSYAVACADSPMVSDLVLSSLSAQGDATAYLFPTGEWADRLTKLLQ